MIFTNLSSKSVKGVVLKNSNGYILYTVLIILSVSTILFLSSLYAIRSALHTTSSAIQKKQAFILAQSGIVRASYFLNGGDGHTFKWETDSYTEEIKDYGRITIKSSRFGFFNLIQSVGIRNVTTDTISGLAGRSIPQQLKSVLVLTNKSGGCQLKENTSLKGTIVLDHGYITKTPHGRRTEPEYEKQLFTYASPSVPFDSSEIKKQITDLSSSMKTALQSRSRINGSKRILNRTDTLLLQKKIAIDGDCEISCTIRNVTIVSSGSVLLTAAALCNDVILQADRIILEPGSQTFHSLCFAEKGVFLKGGLHSSQFISTDSIIIDNKVSTGVANCIVSFRTVRKDTTLSGGIFVNANTLLKGTLISCIDPDYRNIKVRPFGSSITIEPGSKIIGAVITDNDINMKRITIEGTVWAHSIVTFHDSVSYTNALIGISIASNKRGIVFPLLGELPLQVVVDR